MTIKEEQLQKLNQELNRRMAPLFAKLRLATRSPRYLYYSDGVTKDRYFYTTEKTKHNGGLKFVAGIYRYLKTKKMLKLIKRVGFAKRYKADAWARKACDKTVAKRKETALKNDL